jgi:hypothetical protein
LPDLRADRLFEVSKNPGPPGPDQRDPAGGQRDIPQDMRKTMDVQNERNDYANTGAPPFEPRFPNQEPDEGPESMEPGTDGEDRGSAPEVNGIPDITEAPAENAEPDDSDPDLVDPDEAPAEAGFIAPLDGDRQDAAESTPSLLCGYHLHPVCALFPEMSDTEFTALSDDIRANGLLSPIVRDGDYIVDGRHRLKACIAVGVEPEIKEWREVYAGPMSLPQWILSVNAHRRHLTPIQLAAAHVAVHGWEEREEARRRQAEGGRHGGEAAGWGRPAHDRLPTISTEPYSTDDPSPDPPENGTTEPEPSRSGDRRAQLAATFGTSQYAAQQILDIEKAAPELLHEVVQGKKSAGKAAKIARENMGAKRESPKKKPKKTEGEPEPAAAKPFDAEIEPLIRKAVHAVEQIADAVPDEKKEFFLTEVADNLRLQRAA